MEPNTPIQTPQPQVVVNQTQPKSKTPALFCTLCGILAAAGIGFGVYGMFFQPKPTTDCGQNCNSTSNDDETTNNSGSIVTPLSVEETQALLKTKYGLDTIENLPIFDAMVVHLDNYDINAKLIRLFFTTKDNLGEEKCQNEVCSLTISYDSLNSYYHSYYGNSENLEKKEYLLESTSKAGLKSISYSDSEDTFTFNYNTGLGGTTPERQFNKVISTKGGEKGFNATVLAVTISLDEDSYDQQSKIFGSLKAYNFYFVKDDDGFKLTTITKL